MTEKGRRGRRPTIFPEKPKASLCCCNAAQWKTQKPTPRTRGNESIPLSPLFLISVLPRCWEARWFAWLWAGSLRQECADIKLRMECRSAEAVVQSVVQIRTRQKEKEKKDIKVWSYERNRVHIRLGRAIRRRIAARRSARKMDTAHVTAASGVVEASVHLSYRRLRGPCLRDLRIP